MSDPSSPPRSQGRLDSTPTTSERLTQGACREAPASIPILLPMARKRRPSSEPRQYPKRNTTNYITVLSTDHSFKNSDILMIADPPSTNDEDQDLLESVYMHCLCLDNDYDCPDVRSYRIQSLRRRWLLVLFSFKLIWLIVESHDPLLL